MWAALTRMFGCRATAAVSASWIAAPVVSLRCATRRALCPPSRPSSNSPDSVRSKSTPSFASACTWAGPSRTHISTMARLHSPSPTRSVSSTCPSCVSSSPRTAAMPPWAQLVLVSVTCFLVTTSTRPCSAARSAK